ncbi:MAG: DUF1499 domain-containing protein [Thermodesulfobacteriota bacterium]
MKTSFVYPMMMLAVILAGCAGRTPSLGVTGGRLTPCPDTPNCVNSQAPDDRHFVAPISYSCTREEARQRLLQIAKTTSRTRLLAEEADYVRVEYTSLIFRFVDDVEFYFPEEPVIHVRSASRLGYSDMGANRRRVERIRELFSGTDSQK